MDKKIFDVAIVGGGASGLCAAAYISKYGKGVSFVVIEKENRVGKRILSTGNGRCNMTNEHLSADNYRTDDCLLINKLLERYGTKKLEDEFYSFGLLTKADSAGRVYPYSEQASAVLDVLRKYSSGNELVEKKAMSVKKNGSAFAVECSDGSVINAKRIILACGGCVSTKLGADGSGYKIVSKLGHTVTKCLPSLAPVFVNSPYLTSLKGIRAHCRVSLYKGNKLIKSEDGELQFADNALSGICVFQLSPYVNEMLSKGDKDITISVDLMPEYTKEQIKNILKSKISLCENSTLDELFTGVLNKRIGQALLKSSNTLPFSREIGTLSESEISKIAKTVKSFCFIPSKISDKEKAQVTHGGVTCGEIDPNTMESRLQKGVYIVGELLNTDGDCGGYNLHFAFSSGFLAAKSCLISLK
ncbi:MAG: aminoacetone oxidase family FAD-binding enzyme [Clostridiales bacterium]|nr:aminoacetone oxidase family FAD-binding enzyme [Clostridiales bacterium]